MAFVGGQELLVILTVALILFGPKKLPELAKSFGQAVAEFNKAKNEFSQDGFRKMVEEETKVKPEPPQKAKSEPAVEEAKPTEGELPEEKIEAKKEEQETEEKPAD
jgi:TatA/E family protein of Tat protein translocase